MQKNVKITIPRRGLSTKTATVKTDVNGVIGEGCKRITDIFASALGTIRSEEIKSAMYETPLQATEEIEENLG